MSVLTAPRALQCALLRGEYIKALAQFRHVPLDVPVLRRLQANWDGIRRHLAGAAISRFDIFHHDTLRFSNEKFGVLIRERWGVQWRRTPKSTRYTTNKEFWEEMYNCHLDIAECHELYKTIHDLQRLTIACDLDGRNRVGWGPLNTKTSRNAPSGRNGVGRFIFSTPKWTRFLIRPAPGKALAYLDWSGQEFGLAAMLSGDENMRLAYESRDPYLWFARTAHAAPHDATKESHSLIRRNYKQATLALGYGQSVYGFANRMKLSEEAAQRIFDDYANLFPKFLRWRLEQEKRFYRTGKLSTLYGWALHKGKDVGARTVLNFKPQATGAEMQRSAAINMVERGVTVCASIHDAFLIEADIDCLEHDIAEARAAMDYASADLLDGYVLRVDVKRCSYPARFVDADGAPMWAKIWAALEAVEASNQDCLTDVGVPALQL